MYKIEITADTLAELSGKVLSLASKLMTGTAAEGWSAPKPAEVAEAAPVDPTSPRKSAPVATVSESQPTTPEASSISAPAAPISEELEVVDLPIATIDFDTEIRAPALKVVEQCGKPVLEKILASFGVVKASHLAPERLPELLAALNKALNK